MVKTASTCLQCGYRALQWVGRCPGCGAWDSFAESAPAGEDSPPPVAIEDVDACASVQIPTGLAEFDRVLGGGLVRGSVVLVAGEPGVGKSTLMLQAASGLEAAGQRVTMFCGEESLDQVATRARRLGGPRRASASEAVDVTQIAALLSFADVAIVDSVQTLHDPEAAGRPGSVSQVVASAGRLARAAKAAGTVLVLVGHVTKDGSVAGPRTLEHLVDAVLTFEGDRGHSLRTLRGVKNRFGPTGELGVFEMGSSGLREVADASGLFLADRKPGIPGCAVGCMLEGRRQLALELQALVVERQGGLPRRVAQGLEGSRLAVLLAVLERHAGLSTSKLDVYASVAGGLRAGDPGNDLPLALAVAGSAYNRSLGGDVAAVGELGLGGEIRPVFGLKNRLIELARLGFKTVIVPNCEVDAGQITVSRVATITQALGSAYA